MNQNAPAGSIIASSQHVVRYVDDLYNVVSPTLTHYNITIGPRLDRLRYRSASHRPGFATIPWLRHSTGGRRIIARIVGSSTSWRPVESASVWVRLLFASGRGGGGDNILK